MDAATLGLVNTSEMAAANALSSPGGINQPVSPSTTSSFTPPTREAKTGRPHAIASPTTVGKPSLNEGRTKHSAAL
jgi:hypothetical protein